MNLGDGRGQLNDNQNSRLSKLNVILFRKGISNWPGEWGKWTGNKKGQGRLALR